MKSPIVSIIIPAYNEEKVIARLLLSIQSQDYENIETIVIDDESTDKTASISLSYGAKVETRKHSERSVQRNYGASISGGKYLMFLDADMELQSNVVSECVSMMESDKKLGGLVIPEIPMAKTYWEKTKAFERSLYNISGDEFTDAARFFPKSVFENVGGYDKSLVGPEDWDLPETIKEKGFNILRIKPSLLHYEKVRNPFILAKKKYYYALTSHRYFSKHKLPIVGGKSIYFLRPVFYKNWKELVKNPILSFGMILMLLTEQVFGSLGYFVGKITKR